LSLSLRCFGSILQGIEILGRGRCCSLGLVLAWTGLRSFSSIAGSSGLQVARKMIIRSSRRRRNCRGFGRIVRFVVRSRMFKIGEALK
jgi:hypothetical protein